MLAFAKPPGDIKMTPEDFTVTEMHDGKLLPPIQESMVFKASSRFTEFHMLKRRIPHAEAVKEVAKQLNVPPKSVSTCGMKDTQAVTLQKVVVEGDFSPGFWHPKIILKQIGPASGPLRPGKFDGNYFEIVVRTEARKPLSDLRFKNLFGPQRFGDGKVEIGRQLFEGDFDSALRGLRQSQNWRTLESLMDRGFSEMEALFHEEYRFQLRFKLQQWQSHLWNRLASRTTTTESLLPVWTPETAYKYTEFWQPSNINQKMVSIAPVFSRAVWTTAMDHTAERVEGGFKHCFTLISGAYATVFLDAYYDIRDASKDAYAYTD